MKNIDRKKLVIIFCVCLIILGGVIYYMGNKNKIKDMPLTEGVYVVPTMNDEVKSDSAWCATFQLVWNDLKNEVVKQDIVFSPQLAMAENLNKEDFTEDMISDEYYFKIYGLKTKALKEKIEAGIKEKFNQKSDILNDFGWSDDELDDSNNPDYDRYFFYTMLYRKFEYKTKFKELNKDNFGKYDNIRYFGIDDDSNEKVRDNLSVIFYNSRDDFAIKVKTKSDDEVIFYKNPKGNTFNEMYKNMMKEKKNYIDGTYFGENDKFKAPYIDFNVKREYDELANKAFMTADGKTSYIAKAIQTINFSLDEKGGKVKSEAAVDWKNVSVVEDEERKFYLDDTFAIFLKEKSKDKPYFAAKIDDIRKYQN